MKNDEYVGIVVILGIIAIGLLGGSKNASNNGPFGNKNATPEQKQAIIAREINKTQTEVDKLKKQIQIEEAKKTESQYKGMVTLSYVNRSKNPSQEYIVINVGNSAKTPINVTGWSIHSTNTGTTVIIPKGTLLFFSGTINLEEDIYLSSGDVMYLVTGISPIGASFKINKCSGYLSQFQTFTPYISNNCPRPRDEADSLISKIVVNDACFDYIESFPSCRAETKNLPVTWSYECTHFINDKLNYSSCINTHKGDKDFYKNEWRAYLKRSARIWKDRRENIILYDNLGKIVATLTY